MKRSIENVFVIGVCLLLGGVTTAQAGIIEDLGPEMWFDARVATSVTANGSNQVTSWADLASGGRVATTAGSNDVLLGNNGPGGTASIDFTAAGSLTFNTNQVSTGKTIFTLFQSDDTSISWTNPIGGNMHLTDGNHPGYRGFVRSGGAFYINPALSRANEWLVQTMEYDIGDRYSLWVGGNLEGTLSNANATDPLGGLGQNSFHGSITQVIVFNGTLTDAERQGVEAQMAAPLTGQLVQPGGAGAIGTKTIADTQQNVALSGTAAQSSNYSSSNYLAALGIDGDTTNFTHTSSGDPSPATWQVLLDDSYQIGEIVLHNRDDCCQGRLRDLTVEVLDFSGNVGSDFAEGTGGTVELNTYAALGALINAGNTKNALTGVTYADSTPTVITLDPDAIGGGAVSGNFVRITRTPIAGAMTDDNRVLALGEVQILATIPGDFTMLSGGTLEIELAAGLGMADKLSLSGELTIESDATLEVLLLSGSPTPGQVFDILDFGSIAGTFTTVSLPGGPSQWDISNLYTTGEIMFAVPEPATLSLLGLGGLALLRRRRKP